MSYLYLICALLCLFLSTGEAVRCYECSSNTDRKGDDICGAYTKFDKSQHIAVECNSDESHIPGSFCMKVVQQSPIGFIWDGRWRQVIRRCASVADTGVVGVCNWGVYENGIYWEECYCGEDGCNMATKINTYSSVIISLISAFILRVFI